MILTLRSSFSSAHFYHQPLWSEEQNLHVFGRCHTPYGHGHNYTLEVAFHCQSDRSEPLRQKYQALLQELTSVIDHEHLNFVIPEFKNQVPTTENIARYFWQKLSARVPNSELVSLRLFEMPQLWVEITA
ncbi:MAG: 6-carboxytetrahydropterin synthase [Bdellovibrio sp.]